MSSSVLNFLARPTNTQTFNSSGSFVVPEGVKVVYVMGCGGGGGGSSNALSADKIRVAGYGAPLGHAIITVTPGASVTVTIGAGGSSGAAVGSDGGDSAFGSVNFIGGTGGFQTDAADIFRAGRIVKVDSGTSFFTPVGQSGGTIANNFGTGVPTELVGDTRSYPESTPGFMAPSNVSAGGSGPFGNSNISSNAPSNSGAGGCNGFNGGSGKVIVYW